MALCSHNSLALKTHIDIKTQSPFTRFHIMAPLVGHRSSLNVHHEWNRSQARLHNDMNSSFFRRIDSGLSMRVANILDGSGAGGRPRLSSSQAPYLRSSCACAARLRSHSSSRSDSMRSASARSRSYSSRVRRRPLPLRGAYCAGWLVGGALLSPCLGEGGVGG